VAGGNAGAVVASRLAHATLKPSVLLIEAGTCNSDMSLRIGGERYKVHIEHPELNWGYVSTPQVNLLGRQVPIFRGKGLGGSTAINFCAYTEGSAEDYNLWAELVGDREWCWPRVKERFKKA
jgi:choline dehydrogenase-like flavoprotein